MARRKRKNSAGRAVGGLQVIRRHIDVLEPVYEADPMAGPSSTTVLSIPSASCCAGHDHQGHARRGAHFQAQFIWPANLTEAQIDALVA
jgi:hypothetical protein